MYRAPKSRGNLREYHWFCLEHVRAYNKSWNYCAGMTGDEIEVEIRQSTVWDRPTWPPGAAYHMEERLRHTVRDSSGFYGYGEAAAAAPRRNTPEGKALAVMDLEEGVSFEAIKLRYRELVKKHHPDAIGGDPAAEERLKVVIKAYHTLKQAHVLDKVH